MKNFCVKRVAATGLAFAAIASPRFAAADSSLADRSSATQLFKEGRALLDQGRVAQACRKLEESQRLGPGGGTLLNLALCHEKEGKTATAWVEFTEALGLARRDDRQQRVEFARAHIAQLEPALSRLAIDVPASADSPDLEIKRDGSIVGRAAWGSPIPVDPGDHVIEARAPGKVGWKQSVVVAANAESKTLVVPILEDGPVQENAEAGAPPVAQSTELASTSLEARRPLSQAREKPAEPSAGTTVPAWIFVGIGAVATGAGAYFASQAVSLKRDADRNCPNDACSAEGARQNSDAIRDANYATIGFGVGLAGLGIGGALFATRSAGGSHAQQPPGPAARGPDGALTIAGAALSVGSGGARVTLSGHW